MAKYTSRERLIAEAIVAAREVQEFIWADLSMSLRPYEPASWQRSFQKRVDAIAEVDPQRSVNWQAELRKRLLQQAALSIAAIERLESDSSNG